MDKEHISTKFEKDIIKKHRKLLWGPFVKALQEFELISPGDVIAVAISGGKDSLLLAKLMQEVQKHGNIPFELRFIAMNPGYNQENMTLLQKNCGLLNVPVEIMDSKIFEIAEKLDPESPCYMCARMRRGFLYQQAKDRGCNKLALGHHFNDVIETIMMNILYTGSFKTMVPKVDAENFDGMTLIRPMYFIREKEIIRIMKNNNIDTINCGCKIASGELPSSRLRVRKLISELKLENDSVDQNILKSSENVNVGAILGFIKDGKKYGFDHVYGRKK